jgi:hypothetical protein
MTRSLAETQSNARRFAPPRTPPFDAHSPYSGFGELQTLPTVAIVAPDGDKPAAAPGRAAARISAEPNHECFAAINSASCLIAALGACYLASTLHPPDPSSCLRD